jgi:acyl-coenzyme A thioesterase PaaI-like protein
VTESPAETTEEMLARVRASFDLMAPAAGERFTITGEVVRAGRTLVVCRGEAFADGGKRPFAVMQATMTAVYAKAGISG